MSVRKSETNLKEAAITQFPKHQWQVGKNKTKKTIFH